jgi:hypothetical protein
MQKAQLFPLGRCCVTLNASRRLSRSEILRALRRRQSGDWWELPDGDRLENEIAVVRGSRILSAYHAGNGTKFWVITEADRSQTTVLLPDDY